MLPGCIRSSLAYTQSDRAVLTIPERALNPRRLRPVLVSPHERWIQIAQVREKETGRNFISRLHAHKRHARTIALGTPP